MGTRATRAAALTGVVFVVLAVASVVMTSGMPKTSAGAETIKQWYLTNKSQVSAGALLGAIGVAFGLVFLSYLRAYFRSFPGNEWLATMFFGGVIVFATSGVMSSALAFAVTDDTTAMPASTVQLLNTLSSDLPWPALSAGLAVLFVAVGAIAWRSEALPKWMAWVSWLIAVLAVSFVLAIVSFIGTAVFVLVMSIRLARRNPAIEPAVATTTPRPLEATPA